MQPTTSNLHYDDVSEAEENGSQSRAPYVDLVSEPEYQYLYEAATGLTRKGEWRSEFFIAKL